MIREAVDAVRIDGGSGSFARLRRHRPAHPQNGRGTQLGSDEVLHRE